MAARRSAHKRKYPDLVFRRERATNNYAEQRGLEQRLMNHYKRILNRIRASARESEPARISHCGTNDRSGRRMTRGYTEGNWFAVPLAGDSLALGLVARTSRSGVLWGYFFGPKRETLPPVDHLKRYRPADAVLSCRFSDVGLVDGEWPLIGGSPGWNRDAWRMPPFCISSEVSEICSKVEYSDRDPNKEVSIVDIPCKECKRLPEDLMYGHKAVEIELAELLGTPFVSGDADREPRREQRSALHVRFFAHLPSKQAAAQASRLLAAEGFTIDTAEPDTDEHLLTVSRLVSAAKASEEIEGYERRIESVAESVGGEYDGLEREVG